MGPVRETKYSSSLPETNRKMAALFYESGLQPLQFAEYFHLGGAALRTWLCGYRHCPDTIVYLVSRVAELEAKVAELEGTRSACVPGKEDIVKDE